MATYNTMKAKREAMCHALDTKDVDLVKAVLTSCDTKKDLWALGKETMISFAEDKAWSDGVIAVMNFVHPGPDMWFVPVHKADTVRSMLFNCFWNNNMELTCAMRDWRSPKGDAVDPADMENGALGSTACDETSGPTGNLALLEVFIQWVRPNGLYLDIMDADGRLLLNAATCPNPAILQRVLEWRAGVELDQPEAYVDATWHDDFALLEAVRWGQVENVKTLLRWTGAQGERVNAKAWIWSEQPFVVGVAPETVDTIHQLLQQHKK
jgi:hypothetical protein